jgi:hypothetical protein
MALNLLLNRKSPKCIGVIELDCVISDDHTYANEVTKFPVENGADITDHIRQLPVEVTIDGFVTNSPVKYMDVIGYTKGIWQNDASMFTHDDRINATFEKLLEYMGHPSAGNLPSISNVKRKAQLIDIVTGLRIYTGMVITSLKINRNNTTGEALYFTVAFTKMTQVSIEFLTILHVSDLNGRAPRATKQAASTIDKSKQAANVAKGSERVSLLRRSLDMARKFSEGN